MTPRLHSAWEIWTSAPDLVLGLGTERAAHVLSFVMSPFKLNLAST